jgi:hypothetical protein
MNLKRRNISFVLLIVLVFFGCDEERFPELINEELKEFLEGTTWYSISEYQEKEGYSYSNIVLSFNESNLRIEDTLYSEGFSSNDTSISWYKYTADIAIDKYDFYKPNVDGYCYTGFENPIKWGNLELDFSNIQMIYAESSVDVHEILKNVIKERLGNLVHSNQTGDTLALENCYYAMPKLIRIP